MNTNETVGEITPLLRRHHGGDRQAYDDLLIALGDPESAARELRLALAGAQRQYVLGDRRTARLQEALERAVKW